MSFLKSLYGKDPLDKIGIFITGAPRSGTSMITKVIDAHPDVAVLMENIFQNRRRHWSKAAFWDSPQALKEEACKVFSKLKEPVIGNKVCTPDIWSADDILLFCSMFQDFKIVFIVRDPVHVALSRFRREDYEAEFNEEAKKNILLDFRTRSLTYTSSWRQSIENFWRLRDGYPEKVYLVYYEDFCQDFSDEVKELFRFLNLPFRDEILNWHKFPHHNRDGDLVDDLKYNDTPVELKKNKSGDLSHSVLEQIDTAIKSIDTHYNLWKKRLL